VASDCNSVDADVDFRGWYEWNSLRGSRVIVEVVSSEGVGDTVQLCFPWESFDSGLNVLVAFDMFEGECDWKAEKNLNNAYDKITLGASRGWK